MNRTGRLFLHVALLAIGALATAQANAQTTDDATVCGGPWTTVAADDRIAACTRIIDSGQWRANALRWAYLNRCLAQYDKRAWDEALLDCSKAIELDPKYAHSFVDRGVVWRAKGDNDKAIADYDEAIRLDPKYARAFVHRGIAWRAKGDYERAMADFGEAIRLDPKDAKAFIHRGYAWFFKGDNDRAIADNDEAIRLDPKDAQAYFGRGVAFFAGGSLADAPADFAKANALDPKYAFAALWLDIAERRNRLPSPLADLATKLDMTIWPAPIVRYLLGEIDLAALLAAAGDSDPGKARGQLCEARFFAGELALIDGDKDQAKDLLRLAASECPRNFVQRPAANAELRTLGASP